VARRPQTTGGADDDDTRESVQSDTA